ncbi:hypothetical protein CCO03_14335 [Comamonas serinivorans]|uniref:UmuC domain-containing protein n=1 Tax=Comamonas serinivorans TaxID=1082851 RepID=A0A1Y0ET76_9BURK|nr:hypothetical protein CCO03_14335 [Comamonas serinivorans]
MGYWGLRFSPRVAVLDDAVLVDVAASARLFGGLQPLQQLVEGGAQALGAHVAWAPTGTAALALARCGVRDGFAAPLAQVLDALPLHALPAVALQHPTLARLGCRTLGDVRRLPRAGLARRVGAELLLALDQAHGLAPEVYAWLRLPEAFEAQLSLLHTVDSAPALLFGATRLLRQLVAWLQARHLGALAIELQWVHEGWRSHDADTRGRLCVRSGQPTQHLAHLTRLLGEHLAQVQLQAPVDQLTLTAPEVAPVVHDSHTLVPDGGQRSRSVAEALERIQARLGPDSVRHATVLADHRLEWMQRWQPPLASPAASSPAVWRRAATSVGSAPAGASPAPGPADLANLAGFSLPVPSWLLPQPLRLVVRHHRPHHQGPLQLLLGPDRVEGGWWHRVPASHHLADSTVACPPGDGHSLNVQRDYWLALSPRAGLLSVFQQRLAGDEIGWFLHGHYA